MPSGLQVTHTLNAVGAATQVNTNVGLSYNYTYNQYGQLTFESDSKGNSATYSYHPESAPGGAASPSGAGRSQDSATGGYLKAIAGNLQQKNFHAYDATGNLTNYSDSTGVLSQFSFNAHNELTAQSMNASSPGTSLSSLNYAATYQRDANGNVATGSETWGAGATPLARTFSVAYNLRNDPLTMTDSNRGTTTYGYDNAGNNTSIASPTGSTSFSYDNRNLIQTVTMGIGAQAGTHTYGYDPNANLSSVTNPRGKTMTMGYDLFDRTQSMQDALGGLTQIERDLSGNDVIVRRKFGENVLSENHTIYDPLGRMATRTNKLLESGADLAYAYTYNILPGGGEDTIVTDPAGNIARTIRNAMGWVTKEIDFSGNETEYLYEDGRGNVTKKIEREKIAGGSFNERTTRYVFNEFNSVEKTIENSGTPQERVTTFIYDPQGNLSALLEPGDRKTEHKYDDKGRKIKTIRYLEGNDRQETSFTYWNDTTNLKTITDANNNTTLYAYDENNRLKTITYPDATTLEYTYDASGNVKTEKQRSGTLVTNTYDDLDRLTHRAIQRATGVEGSSFEDFAYDSLSRITRGENDDSVVQFAYDSLGRRTSETQNGKTVTYTYDNLNNLRTITYPNSRVIEREFDLLNQIRRITSNTTEIARIDFTGRLLTGKHFGNGDVVNYTYDLPNRRPTGIEAKNQNNAIIAQFAYGYDVANFKAFEKRIHDSNKGDIYLYDLLNRIREVKFNSTQPENPETALFEKKKNYSIDHVDNLLKIVENKDNVTTEILAEMDAQSSKLNQYTRFNQMDMAYDPNGNLKQKGTQQFAYDFKNRLMKVIDPSTTVSFQYDVLGRLTHKLINPSTHLHFYYSGDQKIEERNSSDTVTRQYIYGNGIDEILRMDIYDGGTPIPYYFHTDEIGSARAITDNAGNLIERINYDIFGKPTFTDFKTDPNNPVERNYSIIGNDILFQGREYDPAIALNNYRARYYDPMTGRFLQTDPMGYQDSMNLYQGFNLNPTNYIDPLGLTIIIDNDNEGHRDDALNAIAEGTLSAEGRRMFYKILNSPIVVTIQNSDLYTPIPNPRDLDSLSKQRIREMFGNGIEQVYGKVDLSKMASYCDIDTKIKLIPVHISWRNISNRKLIKDLLIKRGFDINFPLFSDSEGIVPMYHELFHVESIIDSGTYEKACRMAEAGDNPSSQNGEAQKKGIQVYDEVSKSKIKGSERKKMKKAIIDLINLHQEIFVNIININKEIK